MNTLCSSPLPVTCTQIKLYKDFVSKQVHIETIEVNNEGPDLTVSVHGFKIMMLCSM